MLLFLVVVVSLEELSVPSCSRFFSILRRSFSLRCDNTAWPYFAFALSAHDDAVNVCFGCFHCFLLTRESVLTYVHMYCDGVDMATLRPLGPCRPILAFPAALIRAKATRSAIVTTFRYA